MFHVSVPRERAKEYLRHAIQGLLLSRTQLQDAGRFQILSQDDSGNRFEEFRQKWAFSPIGVSKGMQGKWESQRTRLCSLSPSNVCPPLHTTHIVYLVWGMRKESVFHLLKMLPTGGGGLFGKTLAFWYRHLTIHQSYTWCLLCTKSQDYWMNETDFALER